jgi:hypothetical protein
MTKEITKLHLIFLFWYVTLFFEMIKQRVLSIALSSRAHVHRVLYLEQYDVFNANTSDKDTFKIIIFSK